MRGDGLPCVICGHEGADVHPQLIRWREPLEDGTRYDFVPRCDDREACRIRCTAAGEPWPVEDARRVA